MNWIVDNGNEGKVTALAIDQKIKYYISLTFWL